METGSAITGIHHIALVSSDAERSHDYYTRVLGLQPVDEYAGDRRYYRSRGHAHPVLVSFTERRGATPGVEGIGGTHHYAMLVETRDGLLQWKRWLTDNGVRVSGPLDRHYFESIYHRDPDGHVIEIATRGHGWTRDESPEAIGSEHRSPPEEMVKGNRDSERIAAETWSEPIEVITADMELRQMHHITAIGDDIRRTHAFVHDQLGLRLVKQTSNFDMPDSLHWYWGIGEGEPGTVVTYFERRGSAAVTPGPGQASHYALAVADDAALEGELRRLRGLGLEVSDIEERGLYRCIVTRDPHGQTVEIATPFNANGGTKG
jgi:glyoxalase family protein